MRYLARCEYAGLNLLGQQIRIPESAILDTQDNIICWKRLPVCYINSQIARDYFIWDGDGHGQDRLRYENEIWFNKETKLYETEVSDIDDQGQPIVFPVLRPSKYSPEEIRFLRQNFSQYLESGDVILFNNKFYQAPIEDLRIMAQYMRN